jgi:sensor histidine kinase YesM
MLTLRRKYYTPKNSLSDFSIRPLNKNVATRFEQLNSIHTWLIVPLLGVMIPGLTGLTDSIEFTFQGFLLNYLFFIAVAEVIYKGNMFFLYKIRLRPYEFKVPYEKVVITYFMVNIVYSGVISLASLSAWNLYIAREGPFAKPIIITTLAIIICVLFINNLYEIFYLRAEKEASSEKMELLERAKIQAELQALNSQMDPHFLYNALTSLSYLIQKKPEEADNHNARLAALYRYVLKNKCCHFVTLQQELDFCHDYFVVQQLRFGDAVTLQIIAGNQNLQNLKVLPLSIQMLVENALKHNRFSETEPLIVQVHVNQGHVRVSNKIQAPSFPEKSTGTGLKNLNERLLLLTKEALKVERSTDHYNVSIPAIMG